MQQYNKVTPEIIEELKAIVGPENVITDEEHMEPYSHDEYRDSAYHRMPEAVVMAENAEQIAEVVKLANKHLFPITPRSAGTGLACGAVAFYGGIVLTIEKMNKILEINEDAMYAVVEPGVRTSVLQKTCEDVGLFYAGDPCSGDSCFIGGNIATNAGGNRAVKYGTTRHQVYSIEVVTPTGKIVTLGARLKKQSTGYCMDQLVIGSEGTLGIITKATLKLVPKPEYMMDLLAVYTDRTSAINTVGKILKAGITPTCVEFMDNATIKSVEKYLNTSLQQSDTGNYLIVEVEGINEDDLDEKAMKLDEICSEMGATDVLVADHDSIWRARKNYSEAIRTETPHLSKEDIVMPIDLEPDLLAEILRCAEKYKLDTRIVSHAGDGNIHLNILWPQDEDYEDWHKRVDANQQEVYSFIYSHGGRLSGEHGIGYKRKPLMEQFTNPDELEMMRAIKLALDPNNIMNPGKVFDAVK